MVKRIGAAAAASAVAVAVGGGVLVWQVTGGEVPAGARTSIGGVALDAEPSEYVFVPLEGVYYGRSYDGRTIRFVMKDGLVSEFQVDRLRFGSTVVQVAGMSWPYTCNSDDGQCIWGRWENPATVVGLWRSGHDDVKWELRLQDLR